MDLAAKNAVALSAPFPALPQFFKKESIELEFDFDYKFVSQNHYKPNYTLMIFYIIKQIMHGTI